MKTFNFVIIASLATFITINCTAQDWQWVSPGGGTNGDVSNLLCHDENGNFYVGGTYYSDPAFFENDTLHLSGQNEMYVAKYNSVGQMQWIISFGGNSTSIYEYDGMKYLFYRNQQSSLLINGYFSGRMILGNDTLYGSPSGFLAELDLNGNFTWAKEIDISALCIDETGNIFTQHSYEQPNTIDTLQVNAGLWLAKFDPDGNLMWAKRKGNSNPNGPGMEFAFIKMFERKGTITGYAYSITDTLTIDTVTVYPHIYYQSILASFDTSGTALWLKPFAGRPEPPEFDYIQDKWGNNYITSTFGDTAIFENDTITPPLWNSLDAFICKYDSAGRFIWVKQLFCDSSAIPMNLELDEKEGVLLTGDFKGGIVINSDTLNATGIVSYYFINYDSSGAVTFYRVNDEIGIYDCEVDSSGYITACGVFKNTADFNGTTLTSNGMVDAFIARSSPLIGIDENIFRQKNQLLIYANPNHGRCKLQVPDEFVHERSLLLRIFDNNGRMIQQTQVIMNEDKIRVNLEAEAKGIYNVTLSNKKKSYQGKIVFE
ncbi:MAG: T9SS type A sorting domain-containing protein [Bacteroidetes bacterium]|nr:T9SS type A sorting domain-containing protein [Bacteroidota bacterium]